jgi:hypothetical protein
VPECGGTPVSDGAFGPMKSGNGYFMTVALDVVPRLLNSSAAAGLKFSEDALLLTCQAAMGNIAAVGASNPQLWPSLLAPGYWRVAYEMFS